MAHSKKYKAKVNKLYGSSHNSKSDPENPKDVDAVLKLARERARDGSVYWKDNWEASEDDLKFLAGEQWPSQVRTERELEQRPCLTNNVLPTFVDQVLGDQRQNRPAIIVSAVDTAFVEVENEEGELEKEELKIQNRAGDNDYSMAEVFNGAIKNIEYNCDAETSYDLAFQGAAESGMAYLRVLTDYAAPEGYEQEILIDYIENQFSVIMDPGANKRDYSDMGWCLVDDNMLKTEFEKKYPHATAEPIHDSEDDMGTWFADKTVRISEYFTRKAVVRESAMLSDNRIIWMDELEPVIDELLEQGIEIVRTRKVKTYEVYWRKISAYNVLEGPIKLDCTTVPIIPVWGKSITIRNKVIFRSVIRHSKDAQRMANYWDSAATETVALAPKAPFTGSELHIEGREDEWKKANTTNTAILTYIPQYEGDKGPQRARPATVPAAEIAMGMNSVDKIKSTIGMFDASIGKQGNETSGRAIRERKSQGQLGNFTFVDNLSKAMRRIGKIIIELFPHVYDTEQVMRLKFADESEDFVILNQKIYDDESGEWVTIHDLSVIKYDVVVKTGPAYATQREEAADSLLRFTEVVPAAAEVIPDLIAQNMDFPGADVLAGRLKKTVPPHVLTEKERKEIAKDMPEEQEPTPEQELQAKELEVRGREADAGIAKSEAEIVKAKQDTIQEQLQTQEAEFKLAAIQQEAASGEADFQRIQELIAEALTEIVPDLLPKK